MKFYIETERMILREMLPTDAAGMFALDSAPEVHRYLTNSIVKDISQTMGIIQSVRQQYVENGIGRWVIVDKKTQDFVGWAGLKLLKEPINNHTNIHDVGYRLLKKLGDGHRHRMCQGLPTIWF